MLAASRAVSMFAFGQQASNPRSEQVHAAKLVGAQPPSAAIKLDLDEAPIERIVPNRQAGAGVHVIPV
jgi:hypothetical protein